MSVNTEINQNLENIRKFVDRRTKLKAKEFRRKTLFAKRQDENLRRREKETILEAPRLVQSFPGRSTLTNIAGRGKGFLERILKFISYLAAGWVFGNISTIIGYGKEFFARLNKAREILTNMVKAIGGTFKALGKVYDAALTNLLKFDFNDSEKRLENAWKEVSDNVNEVGKQYDEGVKLLTTPLLDDEYRGSYSGEFVPPFVGEERTPPPAPAPEPTTTVTTTQANRGTGRDGTFGQGTYGQGRPTDGTPTQTPTTPTTPTPQSSSASGWGPVLDIISKAESRRDGYNAIAPGDYHPRLSEMTLREAYNSRGVRNNGAGALGRYQFTDPFFEKASYAGLGPDDIFSPANQDKMAIALSRVQVGVTLESIKQDPIRAGNLLAQIWAGLPLLSGPNKGKSYFEGFNGNTATITVQEYEAALRKVAGKKVAQIQPLNSMMNIAKIDDKSLDNNNTLDFMRDSSTGNDSSLLADQSIAPPAGLNDNLKFKDNYLDFVKSNLNINFDALPKQLQETIKQERKRPQVLIARQAPSTSTQVTSSGTEENITIDTSSISMVNTLNKKQNLTRLAYT